MTNWDQSAVDAHYARLKAPAAAVGGVPVDQAAERERASGDPWFRRFKGEPQPKAAKLPRGMNKLEAAYAQHLDILRGVGQIRGWRFEAIKVRLGKGALYKPDFLVWMADGTLEFHETKGHWREASRVRIKVAADLYSMFRWLGVTKPRGGDWVYEVFGA